MAYSRILIAPGPFKECLTSDQVAKAIKEGIEELVSSVELILLPLSDGGTGISNLITKAKDGLIKRTRIIGPIGEKIESFIGFIDGKIAIIESAAAAGLALVPPHKRNPLNTSTYGVGQLISKSLEYGAKKIIIGCGDSSTNDCGIGCASALGVKFYSKNSSVPISHPTGADLRNIVRIEPGNIKNKFFDIEIVVACNLTSILCGPEGTTRIYAPQKGANPRQVRELEVGVNNFVKRIYEETGIDTSFIPGAGGAGGLAAALYIFMGARLLYSIDVIDKYLNLNNYLAKADIVITGEGRIDDRTATGKVACGIALKAKKYNLPVIAITGSVAMDHEDIYFNGIDAIECIADGPISLEDSMKNAYDLIKRAAQRVARYIII
jgi:glycerate kinase